MSNAHINPVLYKEAIQQGKNLTTIQMLEITNRAFTGHESIDDTLVHMNGRVYDSSIGRFISPDPFIQAPNESQNYNEDSASRAKAHDSWFQEDRQQAVVVCLPSFMS